ncbi:MAG: hypothetical protein A2087_10830 [Spirochaetes bacterium GWD1_61_31]|nr:MAG: hypothetical protein A2Y37_07135 [Spirochaetes bacterium GWB1_60_80]OHD35718.1 MAG: hypothetical protein A2004_14925 [Spirochaetes bacterium GWC1_61_12]OHD37949.1 MAG: hypothetical protein A2087_10830 [Spirochaetes bacterium GWD1_61_31]OHD43649.1 MAG: hypothetical protein A2Y35_06330 [Spirochaetes bacterium GWE1_60_18]OHD59154.1 MAG: hypothetical protein A2Y32_14820 [Spirochaetes bacterium GWF1_60_12]
MSNSRLAYHTDFKLALQCGLMPATQVARLPRSTRHRFRTTDYSGVVGAEYSTLLAQIDVLKQIAASRVLLGFCRAFLRVASLLRSLAVNPFQLKRLKNVEQRAAIAHRLVSAGQFAPLGSLLACLGLSYRTLRSWLAYKVPCASSPLTLCRARSPAQLSLAEVQVVKQAFRDQATAHWPLSAVAWHLVHSGRLSASVATIIKYAKLLGVAAGHSARKRSRKRGSVVAKAPNTVWHVDATMVRTLDGVKVGVQFILDNFSRKLLAWTVIARLSGAATVQLVRSAWEAMPEQPATPVALISDGGSENVNQTVAGYLATVPLHLLVAQTDVSFSNSMIEAANKIIKYRYIFNRTIPDLAHLEEVIGAAVKDYNNRPHCALRGLTPEQVYAGKVFDTAAYREQLHQARELRLASNRGHCPSCVPLVDETAAEVAVS